MIDLDIKPCRWDLVQDKNKAKDMIWYGIVAQTIDLFFSYNLIFTRFNFLKKSNQRRETFRLAPFSRQNSPTFLDQPASHSVSYLMVVMIHFPPSTYRVNWLTHKKPSQANPSPAIFDKSVCYYLGCDCLLQDKTEIASWREYGLGQNRKKALSAARSQPSSCSLQKGIQ